MFRSGVFFSGLLLVAMGFGQRMDFFDSHVADYRLLQSKKVQADVGITVAERAKLNEVAVRERAVAVPYEQQLQKEGKTAAELDRDPKYLGMVADLGQKLLGVLTPGQVKRLRELTLQRAGLVGTTNVVVAKKLGMTVDQLTKVRAALQEGMRRSSPIMQMINERITAPYKNVHPKSQAEVDDINRKLSQETQVAIKNNADLVRIDKETKAKFDSVLSAKQLATYKALQGKPFTG